MFKKIILAAAFLLVACEPAPVGYKPDPLNFAIRPPIRVNVAQIRVVESYQAPMGGANVEHTFPVPPSTAIKQWVAQRLAATGQSGILEVTIVDASVRAVPLPKTEGVKGLFTDDQDARYDANIAVTFRALDSNAMTTASGDVNVTRSRSINEKATIDQRQQIFHTMTKDMMNSFDAESESRLRQFFGAYLK